MKVYTKIALAFFLFIVIIAVAYWLFQPRGLILEKWTISIDETSEEVLLPYNITLSESQIYTFETQFAKTDYDVLILPKLNGHAFKVFLNNVRVGGVGDFVNPTAIVWNYVHMVDLPLNQQIDLNSLRVEIYGLHDAGMIQAPYLANKSSIQSYVELQNIFTSNSNQMVIGASITFAILLFLFSFHSESYRKIYLYYALALFLFSIYSTDLTFRETTGSLSTYLVIRKIQMISIFLSLYYMILGARRYFAEKDTQRIISLVITILLLPIVFAPDFVTLNNRVIMLNMLLPLGLIYMVIINFKDPYKRNIFASVFIFLAVFYRFLQYAFNIQSIFLIQYAVLIYIMGVIYFIIADYSQVIEEKKKFKSKSNLDSLTGVYNRNALDELTFSSNDVLIFIDIDEFKTYNDTKGHAEGDTLLTALANVLKETIETRGEVIRYGGDEFIIALFKATESEAIFLIEKIRGIISEKFQDIDISYGITQFESNLLDSLIHADHKMYDMKLFKKREI